MKLVNAEMLLDVEIDEDQPTFLVIEKPRSYYQIVEDFVNLCSGDGGNALLFEGQVQLSFEKDTNLITDPFSLDFNSKRILNKLYGELLEEANSYIEERSCFQIHSNNFFDRLISAVPYEMITYDVGPELSRLFKAYNVRLEPQCTSILERIIEYAKIMARLIRIKLLIIANISCYLEPQEIEAFVEMCTYLKLRLLFVEGHEHRFTFQNRTYIMDRDLCWIVR